MGVGVRIRPGADEDLESWESEEIHGDGDGDGGAWQLGLRGRKASKAYGRQDF